MRGRLMREPPVHIQTIHEKQRNYTCDSCGKSFTQSGSLKKQTGQFMRNKEITNVILM